MIADDVRNLEAMGGHRLALQPNRGQAPIYVDCCFTRPLGHLQELVQVVFCPLPIYRRLQSATLSSGE